MAFLDEDDRLSVTTSEGSRCECVFCFRTTWCMEGSFSMGLFGTFAEALVCERCLGKITRFAFDPAMLGFLRTLLEGFGHSVEGKLKFARRRAEIEAAAEQFGPRGPEWADGLRIIFRSLANNFGPETNTIAVAKAVQALTGLDSVRSEQLVAKTFGEERTKAPPVVRKKMQEYEALADDLARLTGDRCSSMKIGMIKAFRSATGLGLKESKDIVEAAMARRPLATNGAANGKVPATAL